MKRYPLLLLFLLLAFPCHADIYVFVDSNGVRHISNKPDDPRYKLVMKTPTYKKPEFEADSATKDPTIAMAKSSSGWQLITPKGTSYIRWGSGGGFVRSTGKPFATNETNRKRFAPHIVAIANRHRLEPALMDAVISAESAYNPTAVSSAGAQGLMQLMPATAKRFGVSNPFDPIANMQGGARYLRLLLDQFKSLNLAIAAYNAGEGAVQRYGNKIPPYEETRTYVSRVLQFYNHYRLNN